MKRLFNISATAMLATVILLSPISRAETVNTNTDLPSNKKTAAYIFSRPMLKALYNLGVMQDKQFGLEQQCTTGYQVKPYTVMVLSPIEFPGGAQNPTKGVWMLRYQLKRCGAAKVYNASFVANDNGQRPTIRPYFPGATYASPVLVKDAIAAAVPSALIRSGRKDCRKIRAYDMRVTEKPHDVVEASKAFKGVWNETWTFWTCGRLVDVPMTFIPDATGGGTRFSTGPATLERARPNS